MSMRVEWFDAKWSTLDVVGAGNHVGEFAVEEGMVGLVIAGDEVSVLQGTPERIREMLTGALRALGYGVTQDEDD